MVWSDANGGALQATDASCNPRCASNYNCYCGDPNYAAVYSTSTPVIVSGNTNCSSIGCYSDTNTAGNRILNDYVNLAMPSATVESCLALCGNSTSGGPWNFAAVENQE